ncbi:MAG: ABC transporter [delta proteobacterium ML8_F1]|nr:MAG: ABC transporter [delta proteobacterium ML8_F1]
MLEITNLVVQAGDKRVIDGLDLAVPCGEVHVLLGPNGSGKTSLMMTIMGFSNYKVIAGRIYFKGRDITELPIHERARIGIAIAQQRPPSIDGVKLRSVLNYQIEKGVVDTLRLDALVKEADMEEFLFRPVNEGLSGGEIKRSELLQLLAASPEFSMLDEPDSGVDIDALGRIRGLIRNLFALDERHPVKRRAGLIITHSGNIINHMNLDKAHIMHQGRIGCSGNPNLVLDRITRFSYESCSRCIGEVE